MADRTKAQARPAGAVSKEEMELRKQAEQNPARWEAWLQLGLLCLRQNRHQEACEALERAAGLSPGRPEARHHLAGCLQALGRHAEAADSYHKVVQMRPDSPEAFNNWGIALAQGGRRTEAVAAFEQALRLRPDFPEAHNNWGIALVEEGKLAEAAARFGQALLAHAEYPDAHNNLGLALSKLGKREEACASFSEALRLRPDYADALCNLANLLRDLGRLEGAAENYKKLLRLRPDHRDGRVQLALALARQGKTEEAIACLHQALLFRPDCPDTYNHLGILLCSAERLDEAAAAFSNALRVRPDHPEALNNLGNTLLRQQKADEAVACFLRALEIRSDYPQPHCNLASALLQQGKAEEAVGHYQEALRIQPDYADAHFNLGNALRTLGRLDEAVTSYQRALQLQPDNAGARLNLGVALSERGQLDETSTVIEEVIKAKPDFAQAHNVLGVVRLHQGRPADGVMCFEAGLKVKPDDPEIHLNRALTWLLLGDYQRGWKEYEWRWKLKKAATCPYPQPGWDGSAMPEGTILLWSEQGLGDTLQFARYVALVKQRVGTVLLDCPGPLRGLLASLPGLDGLAGGGAPLPRFDVQAPLMSLPGLLGTTPDTAPATVPYLFADAAMQERWRERVGAGKGLKVGLVWQGNPQFAGDRYRSVRLEAFRPFSQIPGVKLFGLQKGKGAEQISDSGFELTDLGGQVSGDFRDTAAALMSLDILVSVDTSVARLAGALGVPLWVLLPFNPDWRWLLGREDSVWYPSARLFRQRTWGDWGEVMTRVAQALRERARRPLLRGIPAQLSLAELVERAAREGPVGLEEPSWAALREAGALEAPEVAELAERLRGADEDMAEADRLMESLGDADETQVAALARRYARARRVRAAALAGFSAWLGGPAQETGGT